MRRGGTQAVTEGRRFCLDDGRVHRLPECATVLHRHAKRGYVGCACVQGEAGPVTAWGRLLGHMVTLSRTAWTMDVLGLGS